MTTPSPVAPVEAPAAPAAAVPVQPSLPLAPALPPALAAMLPPAGAPSPVVEPAKVDAPKAEPAKAKDADARLAALEEQLAAAKAQTRSATIREVVLRTAAEAQAISPEQVLLLVRDELDVTDDGRVIVKGDPRTDPRQHVARFLAANLHLVRPAITGGGAGSPAAVVAPTSAQAHPTLSREGGTAIAHAAFASLLGTAPAKPAATVPTAPPKG